MKKEYKPKITGIVMTCVVLLSICAGCINQRERLNQGEDVIKPYREEATEVLENTVETEKISIDFTTVNGYIKVHLWENDRYRIEVNKWAKAETAQKAKDLAEMVRADLTEKIEAHTTIVTLNVEYIEDTGADIIAYLPKISFDTLELSSTNGYLEIEDATASRCHLNTINGAVDVCVTADDIHVSTINGGIKGFFQGDAVTVTTINGDINIQVGFVGVFDVFNTNGDIDITTASDFSFDLEVSSGTISVSADKVIYTRDYKDRKKGSTAEEPGVFITASTVNGSITVTKM
jgi:DUF4097 and DUF4098 domain-containing protein YvlB